MQQKFLLRDCTGQVCSRSFSVTPIIAPLKNGNAIVTADPLLVVNYEDGQTLDVVPNLYEIRCNNRASSVWYISVTGSASLTASQNIVSGSYLTDFRITENGNYRIFEDGTYSVINGDTYTSTYFNFRDFLSTPESCSSIRLTPVLKNIGFLDALILQDSI